jgi:hypothetical protein
MVSPMRAPAAPPPSPAESGGVETAMALACSNYGRAIVSGYHWRDGAKRALPPEFTDVEVGVL